MSSNIAIQRICQCCGKAFTARTTVTKACSAICAKKLYKQKVMEGRIEKSNLETHKILLRPIEEIRAKEFLTVKDVARLLNCSIRTTYRLIEMGNIKAVNISDRKTLVRRSDIDNLFT